jgi:hypothetical protein
VIPAVPFEASENEAMMLEAAFCPPHVFVIDSGKACVTGLGTLENIPRLCVAESTTNSDEPLLGRICSGAHMVSATIALLELAGRDVVMTDTPAGDVLVENAPGCPDCATLNQEDASDMRVWGLAAVMTTLFVPEPGANK